MMTPKMKEDLCTQILNASRQLFLSSKISEVCQEKGTQKQLEFVLELMNEELTLRDENRRKRLIKRAGFPTYKTFEGYSYQHVKLPPAFSREELESLEFVPGKKNLVLYGPVGVGKTHMAIAAGVKACNLGYKTKFYTVTELVLKLAESRKNGTLTAPDVTVKKVSITPEKFKADVEALEAYIGEEHFISGLSIEVTLSELLAVVPRKRRRTEAYNALAQYLSEEKNIKLTIKTSKNNEQKSPTF